MRTAWMEGTFANVKVTLHMGSIENASAFFGILLRLFCWSAEMEQDMRYFCFGNHITS
jgi:hypothetical protein